MASLAPVFLAVSAAIAHRVASVVTHPFIDEYFHLRQCAVYCKHDFFSWDNKITTPPGLYLLGTAYSHVLALAGIPNSCGYTALRSLNLLGGAVVLPYVLLMVRTNNFWKVNVMSLPLLYTYYFLFYTDVWSALLVLACVLAPIKWPSGKGAVISNVLGFTSLWFRQTNILWIAFAAVLLVDKRRRNYGLLVQNVRLFVVQAVRDWRLLVPYAVNGVLFIAFVKYNGGITFGDKENHAMSVHLVQVFYCAAFLAAFTLPLWFSRNTLKSYSQFAFTGRRGLNVLLTALAYYLIHYVVKHFTIVHPFLLADNRHFTFYLYKKVLSRKHAEYVLVPCYHFCSWVVLHLLSETKKRSLLSMSPLATIAFVGCIIATLVPSPLFEPRYYIVPLLLLRVFSAPKSSRAHVYEFAWLTLINCGVFLVFFSYEFTWLTERGKQRIIW